MDTRRVGAGCGAARSLGGHTGAGRSAVTAVTSHQLLQTDSARDQVRGPLWAGSGGGQARGRGAVYSGGRTVSGGEGFVAQPPRGPAELLARNAAFP